MTQELGRTPTEEEIAKKLNVEVDKVKVALDMSQSVSSLDIPSNTLNPFDIEPITSPSTDTLDDFTL